MTRIEIREPRWESEDRDVELVFTRGNNSNREGLTHAELKELWQMLDHKFRPTGSDRPGDHLIDTLSPDAKLVIDTSGCIVLVTPERRVTVGNVEQWRSDLDTARIMAAIQEEQAEIRRRGCL